MSSQEGGSTDSQETGDKEIQPPCNAQEGARPQRASTGPGAVNTIRSNFSGFSLLACTCSVSNTGNRDLQGDEEERIRH